MRVVLVAGLVLIASVLVTRLHDRNPWTIAMQAGPLVAATPEAGRYSS
jgi:hypothetical protein